MTRNPKPTRIALTGGPGGGKTTAADLLRRELGERVVVVPEAATLLVSGGFPRSNQVDARRAFQLAIYHVQRNLEDAQAALYPERVLLCDRGTVDSAAYWPPNDGDFFAAVGSTLEKELARYDVVVFFETAAAGGLSVIEGGNPTRDESVDQALALDRALREFWGQHPNFVHVPHCPSFLEKVNKGLEAVLTVVNN